MREVEKEISKVIREIGNKGFAQSLIELGVHHMEAEARKPQQNFGLTLMQDMMPFLVNGGNPF